MTMVPVMRDKSTRGWPKHERGGRVDYMPVDEMLTRAFSSDAHFAAYSLPRIDRRLTSDALLDRVPDGVPMVLAVFDIDAAAAHRAAGGMVATFASDEWWLTELEKVRALLEAHPHGYIYRTRGGYRILYELEGIVLKDPADAEKWAATYTAWVAYLRRAFGIVADAACHDWTRLFRAPHVVRDGVREVRECLGHAEVIGTWLCTPAAEDYELAKTLRRQRKPKRHKPSEERTPSGPSAGEGVLFHALQARGMVGAEVSTGKWAIECPWASAHTSGVAFDTSTVLFAPGIGEELGFPHCSHAHCSSRDLRSWMSLFTDDELAAARERAGLGPRAPASPPQSARASARDEAPGRRLILVDTDEPRVTNEGIEALALVQGLYQRGGHLAEVIQVDGRRIIRELPLPRVREVVAGAARFVRMETDRETGEVLEREIHVPEWLVKAVASRGEWSGIRRLVALIEAPALRPDGSVIQDRGYDPTGYLYLPTETFPCVPEFPTREDAVRARDELLEIVHDFPFATPAHRAAWLAFCLTPFARPAFSGNVPIIASDATTPGTGKGRLVDATAILFLGRDASKAALPEAEDEIRKAITSVLAEGEACHVFDNVARKLASPSLDAVATATEWRDRALGKNENFRLPNLALWIVTANNLELSTDTARRTLHIRLETKFEKPENRTDFLHPELLSWVREHRPRLVCAALTILRAYFVAGRPEMDVPLWGSFEGWSRLLSHAVVWVGMHSPQDTRLELEDAGDMQKSALVALHDGWTRLCAHVPEGLTVKSAIELLYSVDRLRGQAPPDGFDDLREAIEQLVPTLAGRAPSTDGLGKKLRQFRRRIVNGRMFDGAKGRGGIMRWHVFQAAVPKAA